MLELSILSPHRDDAVFSVFFGLYKLVWAGVRLRVVNFFTRSEYGPRVVSAFGTRALGSLPTLVADISALRAREDRHALMGLHRSFAIESLGLLDAPIRLKLDLSAICSRESMALRPPDETAALALQIRRYFRGGLVLAPLALGGHVDHLSVRNAAFSCRSFRRLGFYEDLPYAMWTSEAEIRRRVEEAEETARVQLRPVEVKMRSAIFAKRRAVAQYQTQVSREEASKIAAFAANYNGGERLWIPRFSRRWNSVFP